jgi:hypothetical protein
MTGRAPIAEPCDAPWLLDAALARIRGELVDLGRSADELQVVIGAIVASGSSSLAQDTQIQLQAADALSQRLQRLAVLTHALEAEVPKDWAFSPKAAGELAHMLAHLTDPDRPAASRPLRDEGDCEMF